MPRPLTVRISEHPFNTRLYSARHCNRIINVFGLVVIVGESVFELRNTCIK